MKRFICLVSIFSCSIYPALTNYNIQMALFYGDSVLFEKTDRNHYAFPSKTFANEPAFNPTLVLDALSEEIASKITIEGVFATNIERINYTTYARVYVAAIFHSFPDDLSHYYEWYTPAEALYLPLCPEDLMAVYRLYKKKYLK